MVGRRYSFLISFSNSIYVQFHLYLGIHSREWISPATVIYIAYSFLSKYGQDQTITHFVDQFDFYILPVFNVDGYKYTWITGKSQYF